MQVGDKVYRYKFDLSSARKSVDVFEVDDVNSPGAPWESFKCAPIEDRRKLMRGLHFTSMEFGEVKTSGAAKYVQLDHDDEGEALSIVTDYVKELLSRTQEKADRLRSWMDILESWAKEVE